MWATNEVTWIGNSLPRGHIQKKNGIVYYFNGAMPVFQHPENDYSSFRLFTSQLVVNGNVTQMEIVRAFNVSAISVKRWVKKYRKNGAEGFFY